MTGDRNGRDPRISSLVLAALVAGGIVLGVAATGLGSAVVHYTNSTEFCVDCHVYDEFYADFKTSTHFVNAAGVRAGCADCHVPESSWWAMLTTKARSGVSSYWAYYVQGLDTPQEFAEARPRLQEAAHAWFEARDSGTCRSCHAIDETTIAAQSAAARGSHQALLSDGGPTCVTCHSDVPHGTVQSASVTHEAAEGTQEAREPAGESGDDAEDADERAENAEDDSERRMQVADASQTGDLARGESLARDACTMCHKLPDGTGAAVAPALAELMADEPLNAEKLAEVMAQGQHAPARGKVQQADYDDVAAFLNSLR